MQIRYRPERHSKPAVKEREKFGAAGHAVSLVTGEVLKAAKGAGAHRLKQRTPKHPLQIAADKLLARVGFFNKSRRDKARGKADELGARGGKGQGATKLQRSGAD